MPGPRRLAGAARPGPPHARRHAGLPRAHQDPTRVAADGRANCGPAFASDAPLQPADLAEVHREFLRDVLPYAAGNVHPGFMGWVHGGGTAVGMLAEMLAGGLNANLRRPRPRARSRSSARSPAGCAQLFGFPAGASGLFVTGTSMANFMAVLVARRCGARRRGRGAAARAPQRLTAYASAAAHACVARAMDYGGLGSDALRLIALDADQRIDLAALRRADRRGPRRRQAALPVDRHGRNGGHRRHRRPGRAGRRSRPENGSGSTSTAPLARSACSRPTIAPRLAGIERADSLALDFHKWGQVPYDAGFVLVRDGEPASRRPSPPLPPICGARPRGLAGGRILALRLRARPVARLPRPEDLVHAQGLRHRRIWAPPSSAAAPSPAICTRASPPSRASSCWRPCPSTSSVSATAPNRRTRSTRRSPRMSRKAASRRRRPPASAAGSPSAPPFSTTAPGSATSMTCWTRCCAPAPPGPRSADCPAHASRRLLDFHLRADLHQVLGGYARVVELFLDVVREP